VHLGLMQGILAEAGGPLEAECVREAALPSECTVQLRDTAAQASNRTGVAHGMA
jgi:hypothetical protein